MAYFRERQQAAHEPKFLHPVEDNDPFDEEGEDTASVPLTYEEEQALEKRERWRMAASVGDFFAVVVGVVAILALVGVLISLINWVSGDLTQSFTLLRTWK